MDIEIREAGPDDMLQLFELYRQLASPDRPLTLERLRETYGRLQQQNCSRVFVAVSGSSIVGTYILAILTMLGDRCRPTAVVEDVVVAASQRGRGIGKEMMKHALSLARAANCYKLTLSSNLVREEAHRFYESLGFAKHGYSFLVEL